jgi:hypothetical protein
MARVSDPHRLYTDPDPALKINDNPCRCGSGSRMYVKTEQIPVFKDKFIVTS